MNTAFNHQAVVDELSFRTSRSSGPGGQNVNKLETRVEALFNVNSTLVFDASQKERIHQRLKNRISNEGILAVSCGETRSQAKNRELATQRLLEFLELALKRKKIRKKSAIPASVKQERTKRKMRQSEKKARRNFRTDD